MNPRFLGLVAATLLVGLGACAWEVAAQVATGRGGISAATGPFLGSAPALPAPLPEGTGAISGVVVDSATLEPLAGATVAIAVTGRSPVSRVTREITDGRGRFVFTRLPARDDFQISASKDGYFDGSYGQVAAASTSPGSHIQLAEGQWFPNARVMLVRAGAITGVVTDERGEPVVGVYVRALARLRIAGTVQLAAGAIAMTDDHGAYRLVNLPPADYLIEIPSVQATVPAATTTGLTGSAAPFAVFDPDASSRLALGRFPIPPPPSNGTSYAYPVTFAPDATSLAHATPIALAAGQDRADVNVHLAPVPAARIRGRVDGPSDALAGLRLRLMPSGLEDLGIGSEAATALIADDGSFVFLNVPDGTYTLVARRSVTEFTFTPDGPVRMAPQIGQSSFSSSAGDVSSGPPGTRYSASESGPAPDGGFWSRMPVTVTGNLVEDVVVSLHRGVTISGRVTWDVVGGAAQAFSVSAEPADASPSLGMPRSRRGPDDEPDTFKVEGLESGAYLLRVGSSGLVKSITSQGRDYTNRPFDAVGGEDLTDVQVTITDRVPTLTGAVHATDNTPPTDAVVVVFPVERDQWAHYGFSPTRLKTARPTNTGTYKITSLPAGQYFVAAVPSADALGWQDSAFLERLATSAVRVTLDWAKTSTTDVTVQRVR